MNDKGNHKASRKPSKALAEAKARKRTLYPVRRKTIAHKKSLPRVCRYSKGLYEEKDRCESSLQNCSELSEVGDSVLVTVRRKPRRGWLWLASTIARLLHYPASPRELSDWVRGAHVILNFSETLPKHRTRRSPVPPQAGSSSRRGKGTVSNLRPAGNGGDVASAGLQTVPTPWGSSGPAARKIQNKKQKTK